MGSFYMESTQINYRRDETVKTVDQKLQELSETSAIDTDIAPVFKSTNTYAPGDMVYYRNKLYTFNVEHSGAWAAGDVTATDVTTEISSLRSGLTNLTNVLTISQNSDISKLTEGMNAVLIKTGFVIGEAPVTPVALSNNFRGYIMRNGSDLVGMISNYDSTVIYHISSTTINAISYYKDLS